MQSFFADDSHPLRGGWLFFLIFLLALPPQSIAAAENTIPPDIRTVRQEIRLAGWPSAHAKLRIALISDLHLSGDTIEQPLFSELVQALNRLKPDLVLVAGDVFDHTQRGKIEELRDRFPARMKRIHSRCGIIAVPGNHDLAAGKDAMKSLCGEAGWEVGDDVLLTRTIHGEPLRILCVTDRSDLKRLLPDDLKKQLTGSAPTLVLAHRPEVFDFIDDTTTCLVLAGHTHGGLVNLPGVKPGAILRLVTKYHATEYVKGFFQKGSKQLYVTSGLGGGGKSNLRINTPPEIVLLTFRLP